MTKTIKTPKPHEIHFQEPIRETWINTKPTVVPGLAPSIETLLTRAKQGLPSNISTRTLETVYRNYDLTDIHDLSEAYKSLKQNLETKQQNFNNLKQQALEKAEADKQRILAYLNAQEQQQNPTPSA